MDEFNVFEKIKTRAKKVKRMWLLALILILVAIVGVIIGGIEYSIRDYPDVIEMNEAIIDNKTGAYAKIDVQYMEDYFCYYGEDENDEATYYYFVADENEYWYIVSLDEKTKEKLQDIKKYTYGETEIKPDAVTIQGMTRKMPTEMKKLAIKYLNELYKDDVYDEETFEAEYGNIMLTTLQNPNSGAEGFVVVAVILVIIEIFVLAFYIKVKIEIKRSKKILQENEDDIERELGRASVYQWKKSMYITPNYIIDLKNGLHIIKIKEILWMYPMYHYTNGVKNSQQIMIQTKDFKMHSIANMSSFQKTTAFEEMYNLIYSYNPEMITGFTDESKKKVREFRKNKNNV